ncbi:SRPBCC family protein [Pontibacter fetidus]|uniref:Ligand-binding SRPBCC domain-containing protein n=1 Tax=Pontibacter fetidus TaxID=2700082 RepID=A0A6B2GY32_9BACT|nr:hypothetical protein [Pontibacter fetidus]NDK54913.1 hypothetical protein [Pontibacter fetidus]
MQIHLKTNVAQNYRQVFEAFDEQLFRKLAPPYPKLKLIRFDGSEPGDVVEVELQTGIKSFRWTSMITERTITEREAWFIDEGQILPSPLKLWHHKHLVTANSTGTIIHDIINYSSGNKVLDLVLYPFMVAAFGMRKPIYQGVFGKL